MTTTTKARTARIARYCDTCRRTAIAPGHRYLRHVAFPGDINTSGQPWVISECMSCASDRDETAPLLLADACSTFCHGERPCARPHRHDGGHQCRDCLDADTTPSGPHRDEPPLDRDVIDIPLPAHDIA